MATQEQTNSLKTPEQEFRERKWRRMFTDRFTILSGAYFSLRTATACKVYMIFLNKCVSKQVRSRPGSTDRDWVIANNGEIQFSYKEAKELLGITDAAFTRAIDELVRVGLIDIAHQGNGVGKDVSLYGISDRWENFGTDKFVEKKRARRRQSIGFKKGNQLGKNSRIQNRVNCCL